MKLQEAPNAFASTVIHSLCSDNESVEFEPLPLNPITNPRPRQKSGDFLFHDYVLPNGTDRLIKTFFQLPNDAQKTGKALSICWNKRELEYFWFVTQLSSMKFDSIIPDADGTTSSTTKLLHADFPEEIKQSLICIFRRWISSDSSIVRSHEYITSRACKLIESGNALRSFQRIIDHCGIPVFVVDCTVLGYPLVYVNEALEKLSGFHFSNLLGRSTQILHNSIAETEQTQLITESFKSASPLKIGFTTRSRSGDSSSLHFLSTRPVLDITTGEPRFIIAAQFDASTIHNTEQEYSDVETLLTTLACVLYFS